MLPSLLGHICISFLNLGRGGGGRTSLSRFCRAKNVFAFAKICRLYIFKRRPEKYPRKFYLKIQEKKLKKIKQNTRKLIKTKKIPITK